MTQGQALGKDLGNRDHSGHSHQFATHTHVCLDLRHQGDKHMSQTSDNDGKWGSTTLPSPRINLLVTITSLAGNPSD